MLPVEGAAQTAGPAHGFDNPGPGTAGDVQGGAGCARPSRQARGCRAVPKEALGSRGMAPSQGVSGAKCSISQGHLGPSKSPNCLPLWQVGSLPVSGPAGRGEGRRPAARRRAPTAREPASRPPGLARVRSAAERTPPGPPSPRPGFRSAPSAPAASRARPACTRPSWARGPRGAWKAGAERSEGPRAARRGSGGARGARGPGRTRLARRRAPPLPPRPGERAAVTSRAASQPRAPPGRARVRTPSTWARGPGGRGAAWSPRGREGLRATMGPGAPRHPATGFPRGKDVGGSGDRLGSTFQ